MLFDKKRWEPKIPIVKPVKAKPKPKLKPWQQVLRKAALYIKKHGWVRNVRRNYHGQVCVLGAIDSVTESDELRIRAANAFMRRVGPVAYWNDKTAENAEQVIKELRAAARGG